MKNIFVTIIVYMKLIKSFRLRWLLMIGSPARIRLICQLVRLSQNGMLADTPMSEIARRSGMTRQMLGNILNDYAFKGLIKININDGDQRSRRVELLSSFWLELRRELGPLFNEHVVPVAGMQVNGNVFPENRI